MVPGNPIQVKSPTASGKTGVIVGITEGLKYNEQAADPVGVLILVPRKDILQQTLEAFEDFDSKIKPGAYFGERKVSLQDNAGRVVVMINASFNKAYRSGELSNHKFAAVICDESHRTQGV